ncbi:hypothetical protein ACOSP7_020286 [Xanthoceras sorbifolium]
MAAASSSSIQHATPSLSRILSVLDKPMIAKSLNFNFLIKLTRDNYVYWKTLVLPSIRTLELEKFNTGERLCPDKFVHVTNPESSASEVLQVLKKGSSFVADYILKIKGIGDGLRSAGEVVTDCDLLLNVLNGLGHKFDPVVVMITSQQAP